MKSHLITVISVAILELLISGSVLAVDQSQDHTKYSESGLIWYNKADYVKAIADFDQAIQLDPNNPVYYNNRGNAWYYLADYTKAIADLDHAIQLDPNKPVFFNNRANAWSSRGNQSAANADLITADLLRASVFEMVKEGELEQRVREALPDASRVSLVVAVPQFQQSPAITVHVVIQREALVQYYLCTVSSELVWQDFVKTFAEQSAMATIVRECDTHDTPYFADSRGVQVVFEFAKARELNVAPNRSLRLTPEVLKHFRIIRQSDYPADRTAVIITEAHDCLDEQITSYRGLQALLADNPWLTRQGETAFLVEAWGADQPLSVEPLIRTRPHPSDSLVMAALGTMLVPAYVAIEWSHQHGIPLIGHEDMELYRFCNYLHWATFTNFWSGKTLEMARFFMGASVMARNQSSGETFVRTLNEYNCPILFIGYGHVGPYQDDTNRHNSNAILDDKTWTVSLQPLLLAFFLKKLMPDEDADWLSTVSQRSVASYLKEKQIGFVLLSPRPDPHLDGILRSQLRVDYIALRKAQHDGTMQPYLDQYRNGSSDGCTTMPDPEGLADILPDLESIGLPDGELFTSEGRAEQLFQMLAECGEILGCFPSGTPVHTASGLQAIETLKAGDLVWGCDTQTGIWEKHKVVGVTQADYSGDFVSLTVGNEKVTATGNHPFWVCSGLKVADRPHASHISAVDSAMTVNGRWVNARDLQAGDRLLSATGELVTVDAIQLATNQQVVYTVRVAGVQTFAVGDCGLLVHNNCNWVPEKLMRDPKFEANLVAHRKRLNRNFKKPIGSAAHHLIPVAEAQQSQVMKAAAKLGYNINRPRNGMFLPRTEEAAKALRVPLASVHRGSHQRYSDYVADRLRKLDTDFKSSAKPWNRDNIMKKISNLENDLRAQLRMGRLDLGE